MTNKELKTILLVEDEAVSARLSITIFKKYGYNVLHVQTGEEAVNIVQKTPGINLLLIDIELGHGIDGAETAQMILAEYDIPVIFLTSHTEPEIISKTEGINSYGYIVKDSGEAVLIASIKTGYNLFEERIKKQIKSGDALREIEERYKSIITVSNTGVWEYNPVSGHLWCSPEYFKMLDIAPGDCRTPDTQSLNDVWVDLIHPDDRENALNILSDFHLNGATGTYENYYRMRHRNGEWIYIWSRGCALKDKNGNPTDLIIGIHIDITRLKLAEEVFLQNNKELTDLNIELSTMNHVFMAMNQELLKINNKLRESEEHYRTLFENTGSGIIVIEEDTTISLVNQFFADSTGYSRDEIENKKKLTEIFCDEEQSQMLKEPFISRENPGKTKSGYEFNFKNKHNEILYYLIFVSLIPGTKKSIASIIDITDRKKVEAALKIAEEKYRNLFMNSQIGIFITEIDTGSLLEANDRLAQQFGYKDREDILRQSIFINDFYIEKDVRDNMISFIKKWGEIRNYEVQFKQRDGSLLWVRYSGSLDIDKGWITGVAEDITALKKAESEKNVIYNELLASEKKYRLIFENSSIGLLHFDCKGILTECNSVFESMTELTLNDLIGYELLKSADTGITAAVASALNGHSGRYEGTYHFNTSANHNLLSIQLEPIYDENENIIGGVGIVENITDKRAAERAMLDELEKERSRIGHILHDSLGQKLGAVLYLVQAFRKQYDKTGELSHSDIEKLVDLASSALDETRALSRGLDLPAIDIGGFHESLNEIVLKIRTIYGIEVRLEVQDSLTQYDKLKLTNLNYIILESINNAIRHGKAYKVLLHYYTEETKGFFTIESYQRVLLKYDNPGMGLRTMKYRAEAAGMGFSISSEKKKISVKVELGDIPYINSSNKQSL